jgi:hypothetical protein
MGNTLLVLGNGFDLNCRLKSTYKNFFDREFEKRIGYKEFSHIHLLWINNSHNFESSFCNFMNNHKSLLFEELTLWDLLFIMKSNRNVANAEWNQVESMILESVSYKGPKDDSHFGWDFIKTMISRDIEFSLEQTREYTTRTDYVLFMLVIIYYDYLQAVSSCIPNTRFRTNSSYRVSDWEHFLLKQLRVFESHFCSYLQKEVEECQLFHHRAKALFKSILRNQHKLFIMSFNYIKYDKQDYIVSIDNVHGTIDRENIIFGVDDKDLPVDSKYYIFTKTCRKLTQFTEYSKEITNVMSRPIDEIAFYGHSLSTPDYSYFQSIFDYYDIYHSDVRLMFFYSIYDEKLIDKINSDVINSTISLMKSYGKTLDNADHGANLLHKLIIENRLQIVKIYQ